jgi:hypothetical protein
LRHVVIFNPSAIHFKAVVISLVHLFSAAGAPNSDSARDVIDVIRVDSEIGVPSRREFSVTALNALSPIIPSFSFGRLEINSTRDGQPANLATAYENSLSQRA